MKRKAPVEKALVETKYRSGLEEKIAAQLETEGIEFTYEACRVPYSVPAREAKYIPDFCVLKSNMIIEGKGHFGASTFGGRFSNMSKKSAEERQKFALLKEQHPELDIRFVFSRASAPIYKNSPTSHAKWAEDHGFKWAEKTVPPAWIKEIKEQQKRKEK